MSTLFSPTCIRGCEFRNRIVMPPMATSLATRDGLAVREILDHYAERAGADVGTVIVEHTYVTRSGRVNDRQLGAHTDSAIAGLSELAGTIEECGARPVIQLTHAGASGAGDEQGTVFGAGSVPRPGKEDVTPRPLTVEEMQYLAERFAWSAAQCIEAGFAGVQLHGAHGYLLNQFLSPLTNDRRDSYGGDLEARGRYPLEVVELVREAIGEDALLYYRLGADDLMCGGLTVEETAPFAARLAGAGVDVVDISGGMGGYRPEETREGHFLPLNRAIRDHVGDEVPLILTGGIVNPETAEQLLRDPAVDFVGIGRALLSDPHWATRARGQVGR